MIGEIVAGILLGPSLLGARARRSALLFPADVAAAPRVAGARSAWSSSCSWSASSSTSALLRGRGRRRGGDLATPASSCRSCSASPLALPLSTSCSAPDAVVHRRSPCSWASSMSITAFPVLARILTERRLLQAPARRGHHRLRRGRRRHRLVPPRRSSSRSPAAARRRRRARDRRSGPRLHRGHGRCVVRPLLARLSRAYDEAGRVPGRCMVGAILVGVLLSALATERSASTPSSAPSCSALIMPRTGRAQRRRPRRSSRTSSSSSSCRCSSPSAACAPRSACSTDAELWLIVLA